MLMTQNYNKKHVKLNCKALQQILKLTLYSVQEPTKQLDCELFQYQHEEVHHLKNTYDEGEEKSTVYII